MTWSNLSSMIVLSLLDSLNPATIATMMILLPLVQKKWHTLLFVIGTFIVYFATGFLLYLGVDTYLKAIITEVLHAFSRYIGVGEVVTASVLAMIGIVQTYKLARRMIKKEQRTNDYMASVVKMVSPLALVVLAVTSTLMDIPTAIPYFGFIGIVSSVRMDILTAIALFVAYCSVYVMPMILLFLISDLIQGEKYYKIENMFKNIINRASEYLLPILLFLISALLLRDGFSRL